MKHYKIGSWVNVDSNNIELLKKNGSVISPSVLLGKNIEFCIPVHLSARSQIKNNVRIDKFTFVNWDSVVYPNVNIGAYCSIGRGVQIGLAMHPTTWLSTHTFQYSDEWFPSVEELKFDRKLQHTHHQRTIIGSDVWIGNNALINSGVKIGHGAIIGAGAVVTKDIPDYAIVGGVPAKVIRFRFEEGVIRELLETKWWLHNPDSLSNLDFNDIYSCLKKLKNLNKA